MKTPFYCVHKETQQLGWAYMSRKNFNGDIIYTIYWFGKKIKTPHWYNTDPHPKDTQTLEVLSVITKEEAISY